jgi:hypothetical protein
MRLKLSHVSNTNIQYRHATAGDGTAPMHYIPNSEAVNRAIREYITTHFHHTLMTETHEPEVAVEAPAAESTTQEVEGTASHQRTENL